MKHADRITPIAAATSALVTFVCCLPIGFAAAAATWSVAAVVSEYRTWFLGASLVLILIGFVQVYRRNACQRRSGATLAILWASAAIVVLVTLFPQFVASAIASVMR